MSHFLGQIYALTKHGRMVSATYKLLCHCTNMGSPLAVSWAVSLNSGKVSLIIWATSKIRSNVHLRNSISPGSFLSSLPPVIPTHLSIHTHIPIDIYSINISGIFLIFLHPHPCCHCLSNASCILLLGPVRCSPKILASFSFGPSHTHSLNSARVISKHIFFQILP